MSAPCATPESYAPRPMCDATTIPYDRQPTVPGLADTGVDLAVVVAVVLGFLLVGFVLLWLHARLRPVQAEADVAALNVELTAASDQNTYLELMLNAAGVGYSRPDDRKRS